MMENNNFDDKSLLPAKPIKRMPKKKIILLCVLALLIGLIIWDFADPPLWWQSEAQQNQKVILDYAKEHYPNAKIVQEVYQSTGLNFTSNPHDYIVFEQNGVTFSIWANDGEFWGENFKTSSICQLITTELIDKFFVPRGLNVHSSFSFMGEELVEDISQYKGRILVDIILEYEKGRNTPASLDWIYDFYVFWQNESFLKSYIVCLEYRINNDVSNKYEMTFTEETSFENAEEFYAAFKEKKYE